MSGLLDHVPPQDLDAEASVLGSIMLDPDALHGVSTILQAGHFYRAANGVIYAAMLTLSAQGVPPDALTLKAELLRVGQYATLGGERTLCELVDAVPSAASADHYARRVREKAEIRAVIQAAAKILKNAYEAADEGAAAIMEYAERTMSEAISRKAESRTRTMSELVMAELHRLDRNEPIRTLGSGIYPLDRITNGFKVGALTIVGARAAMGKSSLALTFARQVAGHARVPVGIFSLEMSSEECAQNMIGQHAGISSFRLRANLLDVGERRRFEDHSRDIAALPIVIDDTPGVSLAALRSKVRRWVAQYRIGLLIVDYLQLMEGERTKNSNREQEISAISRGLKNLAKEIGIPVIALAQLNRGTEQRQDKMPMLSDLRESGSLEQDADLVLLLYREGYYKPERADLANKATVVVAKNRHGPTGRVDIGWNAEYTRFE